LSFSEIDYALNERSAQSLSFPKYLYQHLGKDGQFVFLTEQISLTQYGIPSLGLFYPEDSKRSFIKIPIDPNQPNCVQLGNMLKQIDEIASSDKTKNFIFGKMAKNYGYNKICHDPADMEEIDLDDDYDDHYNKKPALKKPVKFPYFKAKLGKKDLNTGEYEFDTKVYLKESNDDNKTLTELPVTCMTDLDKYIIFGSKVRLLIYMNKLWADKAKGPGYPYKKYGIGFKIIQIEIEMPVKNLTFREAFQEYAFEIEESENIMFLNDENKNKIQNLDGDVFINNQYAEDQIQSKPLDQLAYSINDDYVVI